MLPFDKDKSLFGDAMETFMVHQNWFWAAAGVFIAWMVWLNIAAHQRRASQLGRTDRMR